MERPDTICTFAFIMALCVGGASAQDQPQNSQSASPIPLQNSAKGGAYSKQPAAAGGVCPRYNSQSYDPDQIVSGTNPLSRGQLF